MKVELFFRASGAQWLKFTEIPHCIKNDGWRARTPTHKEKENTKPNGSPFGRVFILFLLLLYEKWWEGNKENRPIRVY